ncbi:WD40 repeat domain-containing protein [Dolichospermum circinale]|nr:WD40 repeat domain-containing protein [Dolichospermum circinale]MDB9455176.1 WD40 repeat domain-containing protein [Dolichospermum circinale CS-541/06]MDB9461991.1 WD40 repeat domain-containing protein [Dolichospermum circinale CS-541/04]MDB9549452.1 WD40 repeat domain-containing protein [Dolichospermum circinale CS-1031]
MASQIMGNWQCVKTLKGHTARVNSVAIHPDNKTLVSGSNDRQVTALPGVMRYKNPTPNPLPA